MNDTDIDIAVIAGELHTEWVGAADAARICGAALRDHICEKINSEDSALINKVVRLIVRKRAEFIAEKNGLIVAEEFKRLGTGGFGSVFAANVPDAAWCREPVALKLLNPLHIEVGTETNPTTSDGSGPTPRVDLGAGARFRQEYEILNMLAHPGLPRVFCGSELMRQPYYVMQHGGTSLWAPAGYRLVVERGLPAVARFAAEIVEILAYVHSHAITHRDLKPSNILVRLDRTTQTPKPMLIDFGIAQDRRSSANQETKTGTEPGGGDHWSEYPRPEHYRSDARPGDIYSFGRVLEFLLDPERIRRELKHEVSPRQNPTPSVVPAVWTSNVGSDSAGVSAQPRSSIDPWRNRLAEIAAKCCRPVDQGRYASAAAVLADLRAVLAPPAEVVAAAPAPAPTLRKLPRSFWGAIGGAALLLILAAGLLGYALKPDHRLEAEIAQVELLILQAERARQGDTPDDAGIWYREAVVRLNEARTRWPKDKALLVLLARSYHELGQEGERRGQIEEAERDYSSAIAIWNELYKIDGSNDDYLRGLALSYGCRGDVKLMDDGLGSDVRAATKDYDESLRLRTILAERYPTNGDYRIQMLIAKTNYARLDYERNRNGSRAKWKEVIDSLRVMQTEEKFGEFAQREARRLLAISLLDHQNGYLACFEPAKRPANAQDLLKLNEAANELAQAEELCRIARSADEPDVVREIAIGYFRVRFGLDEPDALPALLDRLQTHIDTLPKGQRNWPKSLYIEVVTELRRNCGPRSHLACDLEKYEATAEHFALQIPQKHYFYAKQIERWKKRPQL